jgi:uncharacterized damage-inducible protein DinB
MSLNDIQQLFAYTEWANALALDAAEKLSAEQLLEDVRISHGSILGTLVHMAGAEWIWLERWHGHSPTGANAWAHWTVEQCGDVRQLRAQWQQVADKRRAYLAGLSDADLPRELSFKRINGEAGSLPLVQQLQHVINHATLHRGQVVGMIRQLGVTPPATDLLFYLMARAK